MEETLSDKVYKKLLVMLRSQSIAMGSQVSDKNLAEELDVSRTPVRMALARLESEGLLERNTSGGWTLAPISLHDLEEILLLKQVLSSLLVSIVAQELTPEGATQLQDCEKRMRQTTESRDNDAFGTVHDDYEAVLYDLSHRKRLNTYLLQLENQWFRIKAWYDTAIGSMGGRFMDNLDEHFEAHHAIIQAIIAKDPVLASQLQSDHVKKFSALVTRAVQNVLVPFFGEKL